MSHCNTSHLEPTDDAAQSAPEAPVSRPGREPGAITLEACYARHTGPQGAAVGDALRLFAVWAVRRANASGPRTVACRPCNYDRRSENVA